MALILGKKKPAAEQKDHLDEPTSKGMYPSSQQPSAGFLKKGKEGAELLKQEDEKAKKRQELFEKGGKAFPFWVPPGETRDVTFVDGELVDGNLDITYFYQHRPRVDGEFKDTYVCTQDTEPCPLCEEGDKASYVGVMTVINHTPYKNKKGEIIRDTLQRFVASREALKLLTLVAVKRGGLAGCRMDISRTGDKSPAVGNSFDFTEKLTPEEMKSKWGEKANPLNYAEVLEYLPAKELRKMGFGNGKAPVGSEKAPPDDTDYSDKL